MIGSGIIFNDWNTDMSDAIFKNKVNYWYIL